MNIHKSCFFFNPYSQIWEVLSRFEVATQILVLLLGCFAGWLRPRVFGLPACAKFLTLDLEFWNGDLYDAWDLFRCWDGSSCMCWPQTKWNACVISSIWGRLISHPLMENIGWFMGSGFTTLVSPWVLSFTAFPRHGDCSHFQGPQGQEHGLLEEYMQLCQLF